ncbi:MAG: hypothetical protein JO344_18870 [Planctomycetaceae bacterium]|nr:hypothetical protein [Planctomycetaceae bacterium]
MELDRRNVQHGAIPVGKILAAQAGPVPLGSVLAPTPGLEWGVLPPGTDGYVLTASSGSVLPDGSHPGIAWASPGATSPIAAGSLLGNPTGSSTVPEAITLGAGLSFSGTTLVASGGGGTPGGSSGQIQYDNAGSFGGFTMSGDATLVTSTGVITISPGAVTLAKQANFPASSLMGNPTGSSAAPSAITLGTNLSFSGSVLNATAGGGGVSSVAMTVPSWLTVSGSPITTSGTLAVTATTGQTANEFLATPNGSSGAVSLRTIVAADLPTTGLTITQSAGSIIAATPGSTITFNLALGNVQSVTLGANSTLALSNPTVGQRFVLRITQAASGGPYTPTFWSTITWMTPTYAVPAMPATASGLITLAFLCTGSGTYDGFYCGQSAS